MLYFILLFVFYLTLNTLENFYRERWKYSTSVKGQIKASKIWHALQFYRWVVVILSWTIIFIGLSKYLIILLPLSAIWKILFDGFLNLARKRDFWYQSPHSQMSFWEKYSSKQNKLIYLLLTIIVSVVVIIYL